MTATYRPPYPNEADPVAATALAAAVVTLNAAIALKQNSAGAATDAELAPVATAATAALALAQALESSRAFYGPTATIQPMLDALSEGTEYVWNKTDGAGTLLDIVSGVM